MKYAWQTEAEKIQSGCRIEPEGWQEMRHSAYLCFRFCLSFCPDFEIIISLSFSYEEGANTVCG